MRTLRFIYFLLQGLLDEKKYIAYQTREFIKGIYEQAKRKVE